MQAICGHAGRVLTLAQSFPSPVPTVAAYLCCGFILDCPRPTLLALRYWQFEVFSNHWKLWLAPILAVWIGPPQSASSGAALSPIVCLIHARGCTAERVHFSASTGNF